MGVKMKHCPQCANTYDDSERFCSNDGSPLLNDAVSSEPLPHQISHSGKLQNELRLLNQYNSEIYTIKNQFTEVDSQTKKHMQHQLEQKMQIYWKQIHLVKSQFPDAEEVRLHEAAFYTLHAIIQLLSAGLMRRMSDRSSNVALGLATGLIAKQQEKNNALQALAILDQALSIYDYSDARFTKAWVYQLLGQNWNAINELNYVIANFPDDETYIEARRLKDEIENPPKKSGCFIATAAYGSPLASDVIILSRFRDDVLLHSRIGTMFVALYYRTSPPLAALIARSSFLRLVTRKLLLAPFCAFWKQQSPTYNV